MPRLTIDQIEKEEKRREKKLYEYTHTEEYTSLMKQRVELGAAGEKSAESRAYLYHLCERPDNPAEGVIFFIENFGWTFNPRAKPGHFPFVLYEFQKDAIRKTVENIINGRDLFIEKSRDMGATWIFFVYIPLWFWLFRDGSAFLVGSYKELLVDNKTDASIFGKIDYALLSLPQWLLPKKFNFNKHRTKLKLINPTNNNVIGGDTMNPNFGRGMRQSAILFDELGFWDYSKDAWESAGDSTNCRIANSTPNGYNFYGMLRETGIDIVTLHWKDHPLKDSDWYNYECARRTDEEVAQEIDISYSRSREGKVYNEWNEDNVEKGMFEYDDRLPLFVSWDFGKSDDNAMIWCQRTTDGKLRIIDTYYNSGKNIDFYVPFINGYQMSSTYSYTADEEDIIEKHKNWKKAVHFGDPAGRFQNAVTDDTVFSVLKDYGIVINFKEHWKHFSLRKSATKRLIMDGIELNNNPRTGYFNICILNAAYPKVKTEGLDNINSVKPRHDGTCLAGKTKIRTLDGWHKIEDLVDKDFYVWSYSNDEGRLVPSKAGKCWKSGVDRELLEVTLDDGNKINCTPDHRFMLRDGSYKEAQYLTEGTSLMPFYETRPENGHNKIHLNDGSIAAEHRYVFARFGGILAEGYHIDHIDENKLNNNPDNLQKLTVAEHCKKTMSYKGLTDSSQNKKRKSRDNNKRWDNCASCGEWSELNFKAIYCSTECRRDSSMKKAKVDKLLKDGIIKNCLCCGKEYIGFKRTKTCSSECAKIRDAFSRKNYDRMDTEAFKILPMSDFMNNHKVKSVKKLKVKEDVYDIEVPKYHNFVAEGVVLHNSHYRTSLEYLAMGLEDMPVASGRVVDKFKTTRIASGVKRSGRKNNLIRY
jgi:hypothetical protein